MKNMTEYEMIEALQQLELSCVDEPVENMDEFEKLDQEAVEGITEELQETGNCMFGPDRERDYPLSEKTWKFWEAAKLDPTETSVHFYVHSVFIDKLVYWVKENKLSYGQQCGNFASEQEYAINHTFKCGMNPQLEQNLLELYKKRVDKL